MTDDTPITIPRNERGQPDLQALIERAGRRHAASIGEEYVEDPFKRPPHQGGYPHITAEEWAAWDEANRQFQEHQRQGLPLVPIKGRPR
jgi:hypothetical protein